MFRIPQLLTPTTMRSQSTARPILPEFIPKDEHDAADENARIVYLALVRKLPAHRKSLGLRARRVAHFVNKTSAPTAADWERLVAAGAPRDSVIKYYQKTLLRLQGMPAPDIKLCVATFIRESGEAAAAVLDYERDPSPENLTRATNEALDAANAGTGLACGVMLVQHEAAEASVRAVRVLTETRPPLPARSDRRIAR